MMTRMDYRLIDGRMQLYAIFVAMLTDATYGGWSAMGKRNWPLPFFFFL
jgi:hypothetical protein